MSILIDMMGADPLVRRLAAIDGEAARYASAASEMRRSNAFARALSRSRALGEPNRLLAAALLKRRGELCACEIQASLGVSHATVSHHMAALVEAGLVETERRGKWAYYRLAKEARTHVP